MCSMLYYQRFLIMSFKGRIFILISPERDRGRIFSSAVAFIVHFVFGQSWAKISFGDFKHYFFINPELSTPVCTWKFPNKSLMSLCFFYRIILQIQQAVAYIGLMKEGGGTGGAKVFWRYSLQLTPLSTIFSSNLAFRPLWTRIRRNFLKFKEKKSLFRDPKGTWKFFEKFMLWGIS